MGRGMAKPLKTKATRRANVSACERKDGTDSPARTGDP